MTKTIFDADLQHDVEAEASIDQNGDLVLTSPSGRSYKFPGSFSAEELDAALAAHKEANEGHIVVVRQLEKFGISEESSADQE